MNERMIEIVLRYIEVKSDRNNFEKDIFATFRGLIGCSSGRDVLIEQFRRNEKYGLTRTELIMAGAETRAEMSFEPVNELSDKQLKHNLHNQLLVMCAKYNFD